MSARALFVCLGAAISTLAVQDETALLRDVDAANRALSNATVTVKAFDPDYQDGWSR